MDERDRQRHRLAGHWRTLTRRPSLHDALPQVGSVGGIPVIIGLPDDTLADTIRHAEKLGGLAHLAMLEELPGDRVHLRVLHVKLAYQLAAETDDQHDAALSEDLDLSTFLPDIKAAGELAYSSWGSQAMIRFIHDSTQPVPAPPG
ncbi:MAG TPA: hypothetical protein VGH27_05945 [Streptosporangiaceae bacterium]|jgi:hypothetical protein